MNVNMVDPSLFTIPYDCELAHALLGLGDSVTLYGRSLRKGERLSRPVKLVRQFYRAADVLPRSMRRPVKGIELRAAQERSERLGIDGRSGIVTASPTACSTTFATRSSCASTASASATSSCTAATSTSTSTASAAATSTASSATTSTATFTTTAAAFGIGGLRYPTIVGVRGNEDQHESSR